MSAILKFVLPIIFFNFLLASMLNMARNAAYLTLLQPNFQFEFTPSTILQYGYRRGTKICTKFNFDLTLAAILNVATSAVFLK